MHSLALTFFGLSGRIMAMPIVTTPTFYLTAAMTEFPIGFEAHGSIAKTRTYQSATVTKDGDMANRRKVQLQYPYKPPPPPESEKQLAQQQKMIDGAAAWQLLSLEEKLTWKTKADLRFLNRSDQPGVWRWICGYALFLGVYMPTH